MSRALILQPGLCEILKLHQEQKDYDGENEEEDEYKGQYYRVVIHNMLPCPKISFQSMPNKL